MTKKKSSIPYIIIGFFLMFFVFIGQFIYRSVQSETHLVSDDYYDQELAYQMRIDQIKASKHINERIQISQSKNRLLLKFPEGTDLSGGSILLYRPDDSNLDQKLEIQEAIKDEIALNISNLKVGQWVVKMTYIIGEETYYFEKTTNIQS